MTHELILENIKCNGCSSSIVSALTGLGASQVDVNVDKGSVKFDADNNIDLITKKLSSLGYPVVGSNNLVLKAKSFVSCAIGRIQ